MKTLQKFIIESLKGLYVWTVNYESTPTISKELPATDPFSSDAEDEEFDIENTDWLYNEISNGTGDLAVIEWFDDNISGYMLDRVHNIKDLRKDFDKNFTKYMDDYDEWDEDYEEIYIDLDCGIAVDMSWEGPRPDANQVWDAWMEQFNDSYVDGDSNACRCLVDLKKKEVIAGGSDIQFDY